MRQALLDYLRSVIKQSTGTDPGGLRAFSASGGCIHQSFVVVGSRARFFVKTNSAEKLPMFEAERQALQVIGAAQAVKVPSVIDCGLADGRSCLVMEHIHLRRSQSDAEQEALGRQLAALHQSLSPAGKFGWDSSNFIGETPQHNAWRDEWLGFWREQRLEWQIKMAYNKGLRLSGSDQMLSKLPLFFDGYTPEPSLLHGDLWSGNAAFDEQGNPVLFDPAPYYGDREADMAFTELFGGFSAAFYSAYEMTWPRHEGWRSRRDLYNLYHVLNHFNLFGGHYGEEAQHMVRGLNQQV